MSNTSDTKTPPVHTVKVGNVKVAVWRNGSGACNTTFERIYQDEGGNWQSSASFGRDDLPKLELAAQRAYAWIFDNNSKT